MKFISHRGNLKGSCPEKENSPSYICEALNAGYDVEIDVWVQDKKFYLGHNEATYIVDEYFLKNPKLWLHAKTIRALQVILDKLCENINCFFHQKDDVALTSGGHLWTYPGRRLEYRSIAVLPETLIFNTLANTKISSREWASIYSGAGICSDLIIAYDAKYQNFKRDRMVLQTPIIPGV